MLEILHNKKLLLKMINHFLFQKIKQNYVIWGIFFQTNVIRLQINFVCCNVPDSEVLIKNSLDKVATYWITLNSNIYILWFKHVKNHI